MDKNALNKILELEEYLKGGLPIIDKDKNYSNKIKKKMKKHLIKIVEALKERK